MSSADSAVGMMDPAYFTSKKELLEFLNDLLDLNLTKIEDTASGAIACQLTSLIFPGSIPLGRVNWGARSEYEYVQNYKLLQAAFTKHHVQRYVDVNKLIRAKYQDNLEFAQWLKAFYEQSGAVPAPDYNPRAVRERGKGGAGYNQTLGGGRGGGTNKPLRPRVAAAARVPTSTTNTSTTKSTTATTKNTTTADRRPNRPLRERATNPPPTTTTRSLRDNNNNNEPTTSSHKPQSLLSTTTTTAEQQQQHQLVVAEHEELQKQVQELTLETELLDGKNSALTAQVEELELAVLETENERNYYFEKLRHIEVLLQDFQEARETAANGSDDHPHSENDATDKLVDDVFQILYATQQDNLVVNEDGQVVVAAAAFEDEGEEFIHASLEREDSIDNDIDELLSDDV